MQNPAYECSPKFLPVIAPNWKKRKYPSMGEWLKKLHHRILFNNKKKQTIDTQKFNRSQGNHT